MIMNKRAASLSGWTEVGIGLVVFCICLGLLFGSMNTLYHKDYNVSIIDTTSAQAALEGYQGTSSAGLEGDVQTSAVTGVSVPTTWNIIFAGSKIMIDILTGNWIQNLIGTLPLGGVEYWLGWALRLAFIFSIGFIAIKILFKVKP